MEVEASRHEDAIRKLRESAIPALKQLDGFAGFIRLHGKHGRAVSLLLWDTREHAEEGERRTAAQRAEWASELGATILSSEVFEAPIVEIDAVSAP